MKKGGNYGNTKKGGNSGKGGGNRQVVGVSGPKGINKASK